MGRIRDFYDSLVYRSATLKHDEIGSSHSINPELHGLLELTDAEYILVDHQDLVLTASENLRNIGLVKADRITSETLRKMIRNARKKKEAIESEVAIPRSTLATGFHERPVRIQQIGERGLIAVLIFDD